MDTVTTAEMHSVLNRLKRAQGQLGGVVRMIEEGRDCADIVTQLSAVHRALGRAGFDVIALNMKECLSAPDASHQLDLDELRRPVHVARLTPAGALSARGRRTRVPAHHPPEQPRPAHGDLEADRDRPVDQHPGGCGRPASVPSATSSPSSRPRPSPVAPGVMTTMERMRSTAKAAKTTLDAGAVPSAPRQSQSSAAWASA